jgi:hypothetical protein
MKTFRLTLLIAAIVSINAACASTNPNLTPSSTTTTLMAGWEQHFAIEWAAAEQGPNTRRVSGYVYNQYGATATQMRILAQALDPNGAVIGQRITLRARRCRRLRARILRRPELAGDSRVPGLGMGLHVVSGARTTLPLIQPA